MNLDKRFEQLRRAGLLNDAVDYEDIVNEQKTKTVGFCTSIRCHPKRLTGGTPKFGVHSSECPDCGHALQYKTITIEKYEALYEQTQKDKNQTKR